jgi:putative inorganic carbon (hco3(-)) transporter
VDNSTNPVPQILPLSKKSKGYLHDLRNTTLIQKLYNPAGLVFFIICAAFIAVGIIKYGVIFGALLLVVVIGAPTIYCIVVYPKFGIIVLLVMAYMLFMLSRIGISGPVGIIMDALQFLMMLGLVINQKKEKNWGMLKGPVSTVILIWIAYNVLEVANPVTEARGAWIYTIRSVAIVLMSYFVFLYNIRSVEFIRLIFKIWLGLSFIAAVYAAKQEYIGFSDAEEAYLHSDPAIATLLFIGGHWRKFSIFSDPVSFAYNMSMATIFCIALIAGKTPVWKKIIFGCLAASYQIASLYSGTRGANVLVPAALLLFAILNYNRKVLIFTIFAAVFLIFLINVPTGDPNLARFQTAFHPDNDDSYKLRKFNQKRIQPFILSHPMGGGLGSTGAWGQKFAPGSYLSNFAPDSGYIRVAVELGWLGLIVFCIMMFTFLRTGINNFYLIKDPELKTYCLALVLIVFAYNIANFPQEALVQYPSNVYFSLEVALISVVYRLDKEKQKQLGI